ncbi:DUF835 domain-containing protein [Thermococcus barophilus]|uniref:DUF835 domain-containing protein n=1 Tax=Thermococcus barophilus TaxID=55802 RepID=UPI001F38C3E7|nr:DUF835 domain-containing protein [Thermococcus barophilus]
MNAETLIGITNFLSRWILFLAVAYKATKAKEKGWVILAFAFFVNALSVERYILSPLGISVMPEAYDIASMLSEFLTAGLLIWGVRHLRRGITVRDTVILGVVMLTAYLWLIFGATPGFRRLPFALQRLFPIWILSLSLIYTAITLREYAIRKGGLEELFPAGLILLGLLDLTYPFTRNIEWFANMAFFLAAIFRIIAAVGAIKFMFYEVKPPQRIKQEKLSPGAYLFTSEKELLSRFPKIFSENNVIAITRKPPQTFPSSNDIIIYWVTKVKEEQIDDKTFAISPTRIDILIDLVTKALNRGYNLIYIDAFEYIMIENDFKTALKFLLSLKDRAISQGKVLVAVINLDALGEKERKLIEREFEKM